jgi:N12 class adenine-specific DNA methylase
VFDRAEHRFDETRVELGGLLTAEEWRAAERTTINAHYTSFEVASALWEAATELGFAGGRILEPGCGAGTLLATIPTGIAVEAVGVELDPVTARIARALHPDATIRSESFADTRFPPGYFDMAIGNVPFGKIALTDTHHNRAGHSIHNHFIIKSLDLVRPGGLACVLTSRFTADARNQGARSDIAERADVIGAVRLPEGAFRAVAGTDVAIDMLLLRRRVPGAAPGGLDWLESTTIDLPGGAVAVNELFASHPQWVLGEMRCENGQYNERDLSVRARPGPLAGQLRPVLAEITTAARQAGWAMTTVEPRPATTTQMPVTEWPAVGPHHCEGTLLRAGTGFVVVEDGLCVPADRKRSNNEADQLRMLIDMRDLTYGLLDAQAAGEPPASWEPQRDRLNEVYDRFTDRYGPINRYQVIKLAKPEPETQEAQFQRRAPAYGGFRDDPGWPVVQALEIFTDETQTARKAPIFTMRILEPRVIATHATGPEDALAVCLDTHGVANLAVIAGLLDTDPDTARAQLGTLVYDDPATGQLSTAAAYLSGNVRAKLAAARAAAATDARFAANVAGLEQVQPVDLGPDEIDARLGATWIDPADLSAFAAEVLDCDGVLVEYTAVTATWSIHAPAGTRWSVKMTSEWGTERRDAIDIMEASANQRVVTVRDKLEDGGEVINLAATLAAREKHEALGERFATWVWEDPARAERLAARYNTLFNSTVLPAYDGSHLSLPGLATCFHPHQHQRDAVWRILSEPTTLLAHDVGAGKTATMVIAGQEMRRLGLITKPAYVVPNHMLEQFSREYLQLYPQARVLIAAKDDTSPAARKRFVARCALGEWDAVVMTGSSFRRIPVSEATQAEFIAASVAAFREAIATSEKANALSVKKLQAAMAREEERHKKLLAADRNDDGVTWEATGLDYVFCDEAHHYKNLRVVTRIDGVGAEGSQRAADLDMKISVLRTRNGTRVATFATATPIANSVSEMYTMQHYLQPDALAAAGIASFDAWAANFGRTVTALELAPDGSSYRMHTRFARFANVPELLTMFRAVADVRTAEQLDLGVPTIRGNKPETVVVPPSDELRAYVAELAERAQQIRNRAVRPEEDNMLKVSGDGRRAALDLRLVGGRPDPEGGKGAAAAERIATIWQATRDLQFLDADGTPGRRAGGLQLVFCDLGTPKDHGGWSVYGQLRDEIAGRGVPAEQIRFIHETRNDAEKARLFAACRDGSVAVLIGSTEKMGVGTNVQARCVALHHLDCPWRPADIAQRDGRIIRQGNQNPHVQVVRYVTEASFDIFMWQTCERKASFISQVMRGDISARSVDDVGDQALSYAEVKALATGNPLIMEKAGVESDLAKLTRLQAVHRDERARLARTIAQADRWHTDALHTVAALDLAIGRHHDTSGDNFAMVVAGRAFTKRPDAGGAILAAAKSHLEALRPGQRTTATVGELGGFPIVIEAVRDTDDASVSFTFDGVPTAKTAMTIDELRVASAVGTIARLENRLGELGERREMAAAQATAAETEAASARQLVDVPFPEVSRIAGLRRRLAELDAALAPPPEDTPARVDATPLARAALQGAVARVSEAPPSMQAQTFVRAGQELGGYVAAGELDAEGAAATLNTIATNAGLDPTGALAALHSPRPTRPPTPRPSTPSEPNLAPPAPTLASPVITR